MKVGNLSDAGRDIKRTGSKEPHVSNSDTQIVFRRVLSEFTDRQRHERLTELIKRIENQSVRLSETLNAVDLERYRALIKNFLDEIVSEGYEFSKESAYASRGKFRLIATVKKVHEELETLAKEVFDSESNNLAVLERTGIIKGLLLDMMI